MHTTCLRTRGLRWLATGLLAVAAPAAMAAFSITTVHDSNNPARPQYIIDTDGGLVFKIRGYESSSTTAIGDISSMVYKGVEYADPARGTQVNSGADWLYNGVSAVGLKVEALSANGTVTPAATTNGGVVNASDYIRVTVTSTSTKGGVFTHYYVVKRGETNIHMGTHFTEQPDVHGLVRFIARVPIAKLPNGGPANAAGGLVTYNGESYWAEDLRGTSGAIEASDVFGFPSTDPRYGQSRSKHYANRRLKDWEFLGGTGPGVGIWFWRDNNEGGSSGPFYRSLLQQITSTHNELTYMVNYGEAQTEPFRLNVLNTYTMIFNDGSTPTARPDTSWYGQVGMVGYVPPQGRGGVTVAGLSGRVAGVPYTVGFANAQAQYWVDADPVDGHFSMQGMLPGTYTMTVYKGELAVQTAPVTVTANTSYALNTVAITADPEATPALWRIGRWDGTPQEFINGDKLTFMHPSDVRMASWKVGPYVVGQSTPALHWPAYQWKDHNNGLQVRFVLKRGQNTAPLRLRLGISADFNSARPQVTVNSWSSAIPSAPPKVSRNMTVGTYRGFNRTYTYDIPASQLVVGTNVLTIWTVSGTAGAGFLSPSLSFDAIDLVAAN
ncbi:polysaccharide lyase family protein [Pelomonas sp. UHG3]|uniref:Polysaccharide lyase family protein n=1 Tax=Roseateles hydrophilus TaxID=2975054 RepID=A0ACC6C4X1_9BURK|nr:rhamnogalacturonan lyase B N-terminal domain-containing protein [Pelomonas sp. UHG3]MCY4743441.1 polysaccharide lyase family protein [Pelomonas sp. UHG3]